MSRRFMILSCLMLLLVAVFAAPDAVSAQAPDDLAITNVNLVTPSVVPGESFTFEITVANLGINAAELPVVSVMWPNVDYVIDSIDSEPPNVWQTSGGMILTRRGALLPEAAETIRVMVRVAPDAHYTMAPTDQVTALQVTISSELSDGNLMNNRWTTAVPDSHIQATLSINKWLLNQGVAPGGTAMYEIEICSEGPSDVAGLSLIDTLGVNFVPGTLMLSPEASNFYLPAHQCVDVIATGQVDPAATPGALIDNTVQLDTSYVNWGGTISAPDFTPVDPVQVFDAVGQLLPDADLEIVSVVLTNPVSFVRPGASATFAIEVVNNGPAEANLPVLNLMWNNANYFVDSVQSNPVGMWQSSGGPTVLRREAMPVGQVETIRVRLRLTPDAAYLMPLGDTIGGLWATLLSVNPDPDAAPFGSDNHFILPLDSMLQANLTIEKTLLNDGVAPGGTAFYELTICNAGVSDLAGLSVSDAVGANLDGATLVVSPDAGDLYVAAGECVDVMATVKVLAGAIPGDAFVNSATLITTTVDWGGTNSPPFITVAEPTVTVTGTVGEHLPDADLEIVSVALTNPVPFVRPGASASFEIQVLNNGPAEANLPVLNLMWNNANYFVDSVQSDPVGMWQSSGGLTILRREAMPVGVVETIRVRLRLTPDAAYLMPPTDTIGGLWATLLSVNPDPNAIPGDPTAIPPIPNSNNHFILWLNSMLHANLTIEKTLLNDGVAPGGTAFYEITICNAGVSDLAGLSVSDAVGANLDGATLVVSPDAGDLYVAAGECVDVMATAKVLASAVPGDAFVNSATLITTTVDWGGTNSPPFITVAEPTVTVTGTVGDYLPPVDIDVTSTIVDLTSPIVAGAAYQFEVHVTNHGPAIAQGVTVHDLLPGIYGWQVVDVDAGMGWFCSGDLTCSRQDPMPVGTELVATVTVVLPADLAPSMYHHALGATADNPDLDLRNNFGVFPFDVTVEVTLGIEKDDLGEEIVAGGEPMQYVITVWNEGPSDAYGVVITDTVLVAGLTNGDLEPGNQAISCAWGVCTIAVLPAGESIEIYSTVWAAPDTIPGLYPANAACITAVDPSVGTVSPVLPICAEEETEILAIADMHVRKDAPATINAGDVITYMIMIDNEGPSAANGLVLEDTLPEGTTFLSIAELTFGGDLASYCTVIGLDVTCDIDAYLTNEVGVTVHPPGVALMVELVVETDPDIEPGTSLENVAAVIGTTYDPVLANNYDTADTSILGAAELVLDKEGPATATAGSEITYTITVINNGPSMAQSVDVKDNLPVGVTLVSAEVVSDGAGPALCGGTVCQLGDLDAGQAATITVVANIPAGLEYGTMLRNRATVFSDTPELDLTDNSDYVDTMIVTMAELIITKVDMPDPVIAGMILNYEITVKNVGPSDAFMVVVTDTVPVNTVFAGASSICSEAGGLITCDLGTLTVGQEVDLIIQVRVDALTPDGSIITNTAYAVAENALEVMATTDTTVVQAAGSVSDLVLDKSGPAEFTMQETITYTIVVTNTGPAEANLVDIKDTLPQGLGLIGATIERSGTGPASCMAAICQVQGMEVGEVVTVTVVAEPCCGATMGEIYTNVATVFTGSHDPDESNNQDSVDSLLPRYDIFLPRVHYPIFSGPPDLIITDFRIVPDQASYDTLDPVQIEVTVTNEGNGASGPFWVDFYANPDPVPTTPNVLWQSTCTLIPCYGIAWQVSAGLAVGESVTLVSLPHSYDGSQTFWPGTFAPGTTDLYVYADSWNPDNPVVGAVGELDEGNNSAYLSVSVTGASTASETVEMCLDAASR